MKKRHLFYSLASFAALRWSLTKWKEQQYSFAGKTVVLTGGSRGLGLVIARELIAQGATVAALARSEEEFKQARKEFSQGSYIPVICDVTQSTSIKRALSEVREQLGAIDVVIHNAGVIGVGPFENLSTSDFTQSLKTHFWGAYHLVRLSLDDLKQSAAPRILIIDSIGGRIGVPHLSAYSTGKFALAGFCESIRSELALSGIPLTVAYPSLMRTGSAYQGHFRGQVKEERFWFTLLDSLPVISIPAEHAARIVLNACKAGKAEVIPGVMGRLGIRAKQLAPELLHELLIISTRFLPSPDPQFRPRDKKQGFEIEHDPRLEKAAVLTHLAALQNNEPLA